MIFQWQLVFNKIRYSVNNNNNVITVDSVALKTFIIFAYPCSCSTIHNSQEKETTWMSISGYMYKHNMVSAYESESRSVVSSSLQPHSLNSSWISLDQTIGVGSPSLLQRIFPTQGLNPGLPHCKQILYKLSYQGSPSTYNGMVFSFNMEGNHVTHSNMDEPTCHLGCYTKWNKWKSLSHVQLFATPRTIQSMDFSGQNTGVDSLSLLQGILPSQGSNLGLPLCRRILYQLSHKGSPRILKCVAYLFSSGSSQPRNWTRVSCTASRFFTNWAMREAQSQKDKHCTVPLICSA